MKHWSLLAARGGEPVDVEAVRAACEQQAGQATAGIQEMHSYLSRQITDTAHREVLGPLLPIRFSFPG